MSRLQSWGRKEAWGRPGDKAWGGHCLRSVGKVAENPSYLPSTYCILAAFQTCLISPSQQPCEAESIDPILGGGNRGSFRRGVRTA